MEADSSGEELFVKTRKPYTITKQRERWTDEEHSRFLEALKLYGRAWQRIEEHIGTKSAVQIRSHAQKFFSKLEKEALAKGIPVGQAIDIDIPPPRPKKKPSNPYPRKNGTRQLKESKRVTSSSLHPSKQVLETERLPENSVRDGSHDNKEDNYGNGECSKLTIYQETPSTLVSSAKKRPVASNADGTNRTYKSNEAVTMDMPKNNATENEMQGHIVGGNVRSCSQVPSSDVSYQDSANKQNPAAHAAANFAASFWHCTNVEASNDTQHSEHAFGGFPPKTINQAPSMAAIAAATVAAATSWWAAHGLLPVCAPATNATTALQNTRQPEPESKEKETNNNIQNAGSKTPTTSPSDSGDDSGPKVNNVLTADHEKNSPAVADPMDSSKSKNRKQVDRSSCGSNSSSDLETAALEKHDKTKEETKEADASQTTASESSIRPSKNSISSNDFWKKVSQEGRMAFRALFLREVLPQSFPPPDNGKNKAEQQHTQKIEKDENRPNLEESNEDTSQLELNSNTVESCSSHIDTVNRLAEDINVKQGLITGFKPYKRCSVEARESRVPNASCQDQEKDPKRLRLGEEASS